MKPLHTLTQDVKVGIYNGEYIARIYADKITLVLPRVRWIGNTGGYVERKESIRDVRVVNAVLAEIADDCIDSTWAIIGRAIDDPYLSASI